jgi:hypothetical protein
MVVEMPNGGSLFSLARKMFLEYAENARDIQRRQAYMKNVYGMWHVLHEVTSDDFHKRRKARKLRDSSDGTVRLGGRPFIYGLLYTV